MLTVGCKFDNCSLSFANKYELIHHVEMDHIPPIKKRRQQYMDEIKEFSESKNGTDEQYTVTQQNYQERLHALHNQPIPMSMVCKLRPFPVNRGVHPVPPKPLTLNFCHYRKRPTMSSVPNEATELPNSAALSNGGSAESIRRMAQAPSKRLPQTPSISASSDGGITSPHAGDAVTISKSAKDPRNSSTMAGLLNAPMITPNSEERRFRCDTDGCKKAYKNQQGLRAHIRNAHSSTGVTASSAAAGGSVTTQRLTPAEESILNRQLPGSTHHALAPSSPRPPAGSNAVTAASSSYPVYAAHGPPIGSAGGTTGSYASAAAGTDQNNLPQSNYVIVSMAQQSDGGSGGPATVTTVRQVIQSQAAAAAAAAGDTASGPSSSLYLAGGRFPLQRSSLAGKHPCQYCPKTYKTLMNLNKHIQESHPKQALAGMSYTSTQQYLSPSSIGRSQSPKSSNDLIRSGYGSSGTSTMASASSGPATVMPSLSPSQQSSIQQQSQQQQQQPPSYQSQGAVNEGKASSPSNVQYHPSQQQQQSVVCGGGSGPVTLVAATPPPPIGVSAGASTQTPASQSQLHYNIQKMPQGQHHQQQQQQQQYYMAASPAHAQIRQQNQADYVSQHSYSPMPSTASNQQQQQQQQSTSTTIYVTQQSTPLSQFSSQQPDAKYMPWSEQPARDNSTFARPSSTDTGHGLSQSQPAVIVGRSATQSQQAGSATPRSGSHLQQQQQPQSVHHIQMHGQRPSQGSQSAANARQQQYYQSPIQPQQQAQQAVVISSNSSTSYGQSSTTTSVAMPTSLPTSSATTATIRVSSLKQYHHHAQHQQPQQPQQQQQHIQVHQQQPQYVQIQQQHQTYNMSQGGQQQPSQQQTFNISSQQPPTQQYQVTGSPSFVVRTSSIHHQPNTRYIAQQQQTPQQYGEPQQRIISSPHLSSSTMSGNRTATNMPAAGGATMAQVGGGGGNTVYYRTGASMGSGQPVILRAASQANSSSVSSLPYSPMQQSHSGATAVRMIPVMSGNNANAAGGDNNSQRLSSGQQSLSQSSIYQSQQYTQIGSNQPVQSSQQPTYFQSGNKSYAVQQSQTPMRARNIGGRYASAAGGNTVILQQASQQSSANYQYGSSGGGDEMIGDGSRPVVSYAAGGGGGSVPSGTFQVISSTTAASTMSSTLPYASTAAAFAGADPSTPIRAIVSRGLAEQGVNRYNYTGSRGSRLDSDSEGRLSFHYRTNASSAAQQNDHGKSSYVAGPSAGAGSAQNLQQQQQQSTNSSTDSSATKLQSAVASTGDGTSASSAAADSAPAKSNTNEADKTNSETNQQTQ